MKDKHIQAYMATAHAFANCSSAQRLHVGCIIVKDDRIISIGYNGMPSGWTNECEDLSFFSDTGKQLIAPLLVTKKEVLHAETNAIAKLAKEGGGGRGATAFITHAPCLDCAKIIFQSGIISVYYAQKYRSEDGLSFLEKCGIPCTQVKVNFNN